VVPAFLDIKRPFNADLQYTKSELLELFPDRGFVFDRDPTLSGKEVYEQLKHRMSSVEAEERWGG
jgi:hypothetical protein